MFLFTWSHGLYCILRFDGVWLLSKVSAFVLVQFEVKMPQVLHIMHEVFTTSIIMDDFGIIKEVVPSDHSDCSDASSCHCRGYNNIQSSSLKFVLYFFIICC